MSKTVEEIYRTKYTVWETLPLEDQLKKIGDDQLRASAYALEKSVSETTALAQDEVRELMEAAINDGFLEQDGEWITIAPEYRFEHITIWEK